MAQGLLISGLRRRHVDAVMAIDGLVYPQPWGRSLYLDDIGDAGRGTHLVARQPRSVVGHAGVLYLGDEAHVSTVAVHPAHQGRGIGTALMGRLIEASAAAGCRAMTLEVRVGSERAQRLYRRLGFAPVGVRPGYYDDPGGRTDALIMWLHDLGPAAARIHDRGAAARAGAGGRP